MSMTGELLLQLVMAFLTTLGFAVLVNAPPKEFVYAGIVGAVGWGGYWLCMQSGLTVAVSSFAGALVLAYLSRVFSVVRRCPATVYLISGIFALVPGAGIYYTVYYLIMGNDSMAAAKGVETMKVAVAIAVGIVLVLALPGSLFNVFAPRRKKEETSS